MSPSRVASSSAFEPLIHGSRPDIAAARATRSVRPVRRREWPGPVAVAAFAVALASLLPVVFVLGAAIETGWRDAAYLILRPRVGELLLNTACLEALAIPSSIVLAVALAWLTERADLPGARLWSCLLVAPLAIPAFVQSYAWITVAPGLAGLPGAVLVSVLAYLPFLYLPVAAQLRGLDPALEQSAASLGLDPVRVFLRVVVPQLRLAICGGALLIGLHLLAEYGLYAMLRFDTLATAIVDQFQSAYNGPAANMLAGLLVLCCLALIRGETALRGGERYGRVGSGAQPVVARVALGPAILPCLLLPGLTVAFSIGVPLATLAHWLAAGGLPSWSGALGSALVQTLLYAVLGGVVATALALPISWLTVRRPGPLRRGLEACHYYVGSLPGVVIALSVVWFAAHVVPPLYQTVASVVAAYALLFLPRAVIGVRTSLAQVPVELETAAVALGRSPLGALWAITARLAAPGLAASAAFVALGISTELTATLLLAPNGSRTLATEFWSLANELDYARAAPYAVLMILVSLPLTFALYVQSLRHSGR